MDRAERRYRQKKKWISRLKKLWNSHVLWNYISPIKQKKPRTIKSIRENPAESWQNFTKDRFGVLVKNTGTVMTDNKRFDIKEEHKKRLNDRKLSKEDQEELDEYMENKDNPYKFEDFCCNCDNFPGNLNTEGHEYNGKGICPFYEKFKTGELSGDTEWRTINCKCFND